MGMNVVRSGDTYRIYGDSLSTYAQLPAGAYEVEFSQLSGFFLIKHNDLEVKEEKVYGSTERKVQKVLRSFSQTDRNFGVILSGRKGIGKSLFARLLAVHANRIGLPLLLVTAYYPGIANFLSSIEQEVIVLFDEFEKTFASKGESTPQEELLPLFDGLDGGKKLFVVTCNEVNKLNSYLLNRPGRFHYHFILSAPSHDEIREYMTDKLEEQYHHLIKKIVNFSVSTELTYDILRAIAFELNNGYSLEETLADLNISKESVPTFDTVLEFEDGTQAIALNNKIDLYSEDEVQLWLYIQTGKKDKYVRLDFRPCDIIFDTDHANIMLNPDRATRYVDEDDFDLNDESGKAYYNYLCNEPIANIRFTRKVISPMMKYVV